MHRIEWIFLPFLSLILSMIDIYCCFQQNFNKKLYCTLLANINDPNGEYLIREGFEDLVYFACRLQFLVFKELLVIVALDIGEEIFLLQCMGFRFEFYFFKYKST